MPPAFYSRQFAIKHPQLFALSHGNKYKPVKYSLAITNRTQKSADAAISESHPHFSEDTQSLKSASLLKHLFSRNKNSLRKEYIKNCSQILINP
jgi:hypothetical protein